MKYNSESVVRVVEAMLLMAHGDKKGEDYIDSLAGVANILDENEFELFTEIMSNEKLVSKLGQLYV